MDGKLGELKLVDLRTMWPGEATEFTPWLARDSGSGDPVVIENQLGKTNHDHLGKAITYAAALGASTVIAVRFNVLARPAEVAAKASASVGAGELSEVRKLQLEWWSAFRQALLDSNVVASAQTPRPQYWYNVPLGRAGISLSNIANTYDNKIGVRVYLSQRLGGDTALSQLQEWKREIEEEVGEPLQWNPNPGNQDKIIALYRDADLGDRDKWPEYLDWMVDRTRRFRQAFSPRLKQLTLGLDQLSQSGEASV